MVGSHIMKFCIESTEVEQINSLVRNPTNPPSQKVREFVNPDFDDFSANQSAFENVSAAFFTVGLYQGTVSDEFFRKVTVDYAITFVEQLKKSSPNARLCFLSGAGADRKEKSRMKFAKYKGIAENHLIQTIPNLHIFRPGYIYPVVKREEPSLLYRISRRLYPIFKKLAPKSAITSEKLGKSMFQVAMHGNAGQTLENEDIKAALKSD